MSKSDNELLETILASQKQQEQEAKEREAKEKAKQELEAKAKEMKEAQRTRIEEAKAKIRARAAKKKAEDAKKQYYVVQAGDTLGRIAQKLYGDGSRWKEIAEANKEQLPNPDLVEVGQKLLIP